MKNYFLNTKTGTLHIKGYCHVSLPYNIKWFDTEAEAYSFAGRSIKPCKICERTKEHKLKNM